jgi:putative oxidoreductase
MPTGVGLLLARLLLALVFVWSGVDKTLHWSDGLGEIAAKGLPFAPVLLLATVTVQIVAGLSVALGWWTRLGALALAGFTIVATLLFHPFWAAIDPVERQHQLTTFLEHVAIVGGFVAVMSAGPGAYSIDHRHSPAGTRRVRTFG